jgi:hypothetical protein
MKGEKSWMDRREELLQCACRDVAEQLEKGVRVGRAIARVAKQFVGSGLGNGRRLALSKQTLYRIWCAWKVRKDPSVFKLNYSGSSHPCTADPLLLSMVIEHCLQTGSSLSETIEKIQPPGTRRISIAELYRAFPKRALDSFSKSFKRLQKHRTNLEKTFLRTDAQLRRKFLKQRSEFQRKTLDQDALLQRRILRQREHLQQKFLAADAASVKRRETLQRGLFRNFGRDVSRVQA